MYKILVTGGAGFIGSHLVDALVTEGYRVSVLDNLSTGTIENLNKKAIFYNYSICDKEKIAKLFKQNNFDVIFHLAAIPSVASSNKEALIEFTTTITGIFNLFQAIPKIKFKKFVYFSSAAVYSQNAKIPIVESGEINPISYYGLSKLTGEFLVNNLSKIYNIPYIIFRPANVYGPRQRTDGEAGVVATFIGNLLNGQNQKIFGNGKKTRDFIFVRDVISACLLAANKNLTGIYNLGTTKQTYIGDLAKQLQNIANKKVPIKKLKDKVGEVEHSSLNSKNIKQLGWLPKINLEDGLKSTWEYFNIK